MSGAKPSPTQAKALRFYLDDVEGAAASWDDYDGSERHLAWYRHERTIDRLRHHGWIDDNGITDAGRKALGAT